MNIFQSLVGIQVALSLFLAPYTDKYMAPVEPKIDQEYVEIIEVVSTPILQELIALKAKEYEVSEKLMSDIIRCESGGKIDAVGDRHLGGSYGLVQIHEPSHPYISREQAFDPEFAVDFLAKNLSLGKGNMWTCFRSLKNK